VSDATGPITREEMVELFGAEMPIEAVNAVWNAPPDWTTGDVRAELRRLAEQKKAAVPERSPAGMVWMDLCRKFADAAGKDDQERMDFLMATMKALEEEYPEQIAAEKALWGG